MHNPGDPRNIEIHINGEPGVGKTVVAGIIAKALAALGGGATGSNERDTRIVKQAAAGLHVAITGGVSGISVMDAEPINATIYEYVIPGLTQAAAAREQVQVLQAQVADLARKNYDLQQTEQTLRAELRAATSKTETLTLAIDTEEVRKLLARAVAELRDAAQIEAQRQGLKRQIETNQAEYRRLGDEVRGREDAAYAKVINFFGGQEKFPTPVVFTSAGPIETPTQKLDRVNLEQAIANGDVDANDVGC